MAAPKRGGFANQLLLLVLTSLFLSTCAKGAIKNYNVHRQVDLSGYVIRESIDVIFGSGETALTEYSFALPLSLVEGDNVAFVAATERDDGHDLIVEEANVDSTGLFQLYRVLLHNIVPATERGAITIAIVLANVLEPYPETISQFGQNSVRYNGRLWFTSPYESVKTKTSFKLPSKEVHSYSSASNADVKQTGAKVVYGPADNVPALAADGVSLHYVLNVPNLRVVKYVKEISISQWGSRVRVSEDIDLVNDVARLEGHYSRVDQMKMARYLPKTYPVYELEYRWPADAFNAYYKDEVGNVSTSRFRSGRDGSVMQVTPRFALFGGWRYHWYQGYDLPLQTVAKSVTGTKTTIIELPIWIAPKGMHVDSATIKVLLPEGATNPRLYVPASVEDSSQTREFSYLDGPKGRICLEIHKKNLVDEHSVSLQIAYDYAATEYLRKPLCIAGFISVIFVLIAVVGSFDLSISPKTKVAAASKQGKVKST